MPSYSPDFDKNRMVRVLTYLLIFSLLLLPAFPAFADDVSVKGYFRQDGAYVQPHMRSAPDSSYNNNWSTYPNVNPYTGQQGTRQPQLFDSNSGSGFGGYNGGLGTTQPRSRSRW
jgi:hypothetical protein